MVATNFWTMGPDRESRYYQAAWAFYRERRRWSSKRLKAELAALEPPKPEWGRPRRIRRHLRAWVLINLLEWRRERAKRKGPDTVKPEWLIDQWSARPNSYTLGESGLTGAGVRENLRLDWDIRLGWRTFHCVAMREHEYCQWFGWWWEEPATDRVLHPHGPYKEIRTLFEQMTVDIMTRTGRQVSRAS